MLARLLSLAAALLLAIASPQAHANARKLPSETARPARVSIEHYASAKIIDATPSRIREICLVPLKCASTFGVTGYQKDSATGLYYAGARFYDPLIGGFNGMDPLFGSTEVPTSQHRYLYAMANPTKYTDPSGKCAEPASFLLCAALAGVIVGEGSYISDQLWGTEEEQEAAVERAVFRGGLTTAAIAAPQMILGTATTGTAVVTQTVSHGARYALAANAEALTAQTYLAAEVGVGLTGAMTPLAPATPTASMLGSMARMDAAEAHALASSARIIASDIPTPPASVTWRIVEGTDGGSVAVPVVTGVEQEIAALRQMGRNQSTPEALALNQKIAQRTYSGDKYRDLGGRLHFEGGRFAPDGAVRARDAVAASQPSSHGNTAGDQLAYLYARYDADGKFLKWGITQDLNVRYSQAELGEGRLVEVASGPRNEILKQERELVETQPGPLNFEKWAGARRTPEMQ